MTPRPLRLLGQLSHPPDPETEPELVAVLAVPCAFCSAGIGQPCHNSSGKVFARDSVTYGWHTVRRTAAGLNTVTNAQMLSFLGYSPTPRKKP